MNIHIFVACPIGAENSPERNRSDQLLEHILYPVIDDLLGKPDEVIVRADTIGEPGRITSHIARELDIADVVIADLIGLNPNVMYEVGVRHTLNKPLVLMAIDGQLLPFDLHDYRTIFYKLDLKGIKPAQEQLKKQLEKILSKETRKEYSPSVQVIPVPIGIPSKEALNESSSSAPVRPIPLQSPYGLHHVSLPVRDLKVSVDFYVNDLGLKERPRPDLGFRINGAWFQLPSGQQLHLLENPDGNFRPMEAPLDHNDCHFALRVPDVGEAYSRLKLKGKCLKTNPDILFSSYPHFYIFDPDHHIIEINGESVSDKTRGDIGEET
jgi:catechol 2,3-dioxygenase-like lactoylglutathione lyase family enzyme